MNRAVALSLLSGMAIVTFAACFYAEQYQSGSTLAAPLLFAAGGVVVAACMGKRWALQVFLFVLIFGMRLALRKREAADMSADPATLYRLALWSTAFVIGLANLPASVRLLQNLPGLALLAYIALAIASMSYSPVPNYTLGCSVTVLLVLPFLAAVVARLEVKEILTVMVLALGAHVAIAVVLWFIAPQFVTWTNWAGEQARLRGLFSHPFGMADVAAVCLLSALVMWRERWLATQLFIGMAGLSSIALLLTDTRSAMGATALAAFSVGKHRAIVIVLVVMSMFAGLLSVYAIPGMLDSIAHAVGRVGSAQNTLTLSGRIHIWQQSIILFEREPLFGHGYASTRALFPSEFVTANPEADAPPHAHNVVMQSLVTTGVVGTAILLVPLLYTAVYLLRNANSVVNPFICYVMVMGMVGLGPIGAAPQLLTLVWMMSLFLIQSFGVVEATGSSRWARYEPDRC
jgi:O-antigen ligase